VLVIEANSPGGQAGTSSRIETTLDFPTGIFRRSWPDAPTPAQKFGAEVMIAKAPRSWSANTKRLTGVESRRQRDHPARHSVIATGLDTIGRHSESFSVRRCGCLLQRDLMEAQLWRHEVVVVASELGRPGRGVSGADGERVHLLVRSSSLSAGMSRYLIRRIGNPTIQLKTTEIVVLRETTS